MIFVTVGSQLPFDRLIRGVDQVAPRLHEEAFAQIGDASFIPVAMEWAPALTPEDFDRKMAAASLIVGHAGIGTVLQARRYQKPLIVMPRLAAQREHRNDHQLATAAALLGQSGIYVADSVDELRELLLKREQLGAPRIGARTAEHVNLLATIEHSVSLGPRRRHSFSG